MRQIAFLIALCISACSANMGKGPNREFIWLDVHDATLKGISSLIPGSGVKFHAFQGIPYAEPPVMDLRFKPPVRRDLPRTGKHDTTLDIPMCPQYTYRNTETLSRDPLAGREDCLYLNVYVPDKIYVGREIEKAPVMFWIHGGAFIGGSGNRASYQPDNFMDTEDVIVVSINYRLGALGFLCLEDDDTVAGNMGLKDQVGTHLHFILTDRRLIMLISYFLGSCSGVGSQQH